MTKLNIISQILWAVTFGTVYLEGFSTDVLWVLVVALVIQIYIFRSQVEKLRNLNKALASLTSLGRDSFLVGRDNIILSRNIYDSGEQLSTQSESNAVSVAKVSSLIDSNTLRFEQTAKESEVAMNLSMKAREKMQTSLERMTRLKSLLQEINLFSDLIDDISFQTNILSLNAAVEAARAGEAGKSFSVVAEAVRQLAQKSSKASTEVKLKVTEILSELDLTDQEIISLQDTISLATQSFQGLKLQIDSSKSAAQTQTGEMNSLLRSFDKINQIAVLNKDQTNLILNESLKSVSLSETLSETLVQIDTAILGAKEVGRRRILARNKQNTNFTYDQILEAHLSWKGRLRLFAIGLNEEGFKPAEVANGEFCRFGKWLSANKEQLPQELWESTSRAHLKFHSLASLIVELVHQGKQKEALTLLDQSDGDFAVASHDFFVQAALISEVMKPGHSQVQ